MIAMPEQRPSRKNSPVKNVKSDLPLAYEKLYQRQKSEWKRKVEELGNDFWESVIRDIPESPLKTKKEILGQLKASVLEWEGGPAAENDPIVQALLMIDQHAPLLLSGQELVDLQEETKKIGESLQEKGMPLFFEKDQTCLEQFKISSRFLELVYKISCGLFKNKSYVEAYAIFGLLTQFRPHQTAYWIALGKTSEMLADIPQAIFYYYIASNLPTADAGPLLLAANLSVQQDKEQAKELLSLAKERIALGDGLVG